MGNFYVNFAVKHDDSKRIAESLKQARRKAFVTPPMNGYVVVYEEESDSQDTGAIVVVGALLSREAEAPVLAVMNHDDDILCYWLFEGGQLTDSYNSCPDYFGEGDEEEGASGGNSEVLCAALSPSAAAKGVDEILQSDDYTFAVDRHTDLATALGLPEAVLGLGYRYLDDGEFPDGLDADQLIHVE